MNRFGCLFLSFIAIYRITAASEAPQTITALPAYYSQRQCATSCFFNGVGQDLLGSALKCCEVYTDNDCDAPVADACYCRADLRPSAVSWLSLCVNTRCSTNAVDLSSAVAVYDGYCGAAVVTQPAAPPTEGSLPPPTRTIRGTDTRGVSTVVSANTIMTQSAKSAAGIQGAWGLSLVRSALFWVRRIVIHISS